MGNERVADAPPKVKPPVAFGDVFLFGEINRLVVVGEPLCSMRTIRTCYLEDGHQFNTHENILNTFGTRLGNAFEWAREKLAEKEAHDA